MTENIAETKDRLEAASILLASIVSDYAEKRKHIARDRRKHPL